jgi:hypothetical protein
MHISKKTFGPICIYIMAIDTEVERMINVKCTLVRALRLCTGRTAHR